jgi:formylglycine-generating enzyme required for sulfatase activity
LEDEAMNMPKAIQNTFIFLLVFIVIGARTIFADGNVAQCPEEMVAVPAGEFMMGSPENEKFRKPDETLHKVKITKSFCIGKYEITQREWETVMGSNPSVFKNCGPDCPVDSVSWFDVQDFINRYNAANGSGYRLPTETEWEYAARAGTQTAFYTGDITEQICKLDPALDRAGWYCGNSGGKSQSHPVGRKEPNAWGLYDMMGNANEWVEDWYGEYPSGDVVDPTGAESGEYRVVRGGSWGFNAEYSRCASRDKRKPTYRGIALAFRLVKELP